MVVDRDYNGARNIFENERDLAPSHFVHVVHFVHLFAQIVTSTTTTYSTPSSLSLTLEFLAELEED